MTIPEEAVKAYIKAFGNTPRTKDMALKNEQKVRHALTAALPFLSALEPFAARELALEEAVRKHLKWFERFICDQDELNSSTPRKVAQNAQDAAAELRAALSSPDHADAGKVEGDGIERAKFYHHQWPMESLLAARRDGLVDHSGGEVWRYEYSHKDEHGKYDILYRPVKHSTIPARLPSAPSEGAE